MSSQGSSRLLIAASPPHQAWSSPRDSNGYQPLPPLCGSPCHLGLRPHRQLPPAAASSSSGVLLQCSAPHSCHLTLCPCCSNKLHSHRSRLGAFLPGASLPGTPHRSNSPSSGAGPALWSQVPGHISNICVQPYSNHSRNWWVGFSYPWCEGT